MRGWIEQTGRHLVPTPAGDFALDELSQLRQNRARYGSLDAACSSILSLPMGIVRMAVSMEPELSNADRLLSERRLLEGPGRQVLYDQFAALTQAVGPKAADLIVPALVWLNCLLGLAEEEMGRLTP